LCNPHPCHVLHPECPVGCFDHVSDVRRTTQLLHDIARNGIDFIVLHISSKIRIQLAQPHLTAHQHATIRQVLHARLCGFQRIMHFADEFFHDIF
jgi:hypothetical protein